MRQRTPRRILYLHPSAELYGVDRTLLDLLAGPEEERDEALVVVPRPGPLVTVLRARGVRVEIGPLGAGLPGRGTEGTASPLGLLRLARDAAPAGRFVRRLAREFRPHVIHTNTLSAPGAALAARSCGTPHLWHVHEMPARGGWRPRALAALLAFAADRVVFESHAARARFVRGPGALARRARVVWNGTAERADRSEEERRRGRAELQVAAEQTLVLAAGRIDAGKGQGLLLEAARRLRDRHPDVRYAIVGDPPPGRERVAEELRRSCAHLRVEDVVRLVPFRVDLARLFRAADVVVVPPMRPEPFGRVAVEAMAHGLPVVAADQGGLREIVCEGRTGLLFEPGSADALADALDRLFVAPEQARRMGRRGRDRQRAFFGAARFRAAIGILHDELRGAPRAATPGRGWPVVGEVRRRAG